LVERGPLLVERGRLILEMEIEFTTALCDHSYPGTREGVILVVDVTPTTDVRGGRAASTGARRREELADFLRNRRASLKPDEVGLPNGGRRRTPGLRREEVAQLAGVGTTWYTWLEQGRDVRASLEVLEAIAAALRMSPAERAHLVLLGRGDRVLPCKGPPERVSPALRRLIENLGPNPAYLLGRRWDYLAWNRAMEVLFSWKPGRDPLSRNHIWLMFMDPARRELMDDWERSARTIAAKFRADHARNIGDPAFEQLISALRSSSPEFRKWWNKHEVASGGEARKELNHPAAGRLVFMHAVFNREMESEHRLVLYSPVDEDDTPARFARLMDEQPVAA
jgi:transcriptional regulator with XRE-family HTH domain